MGSVIAWRWIRHTSAGRSVVTGEHRAGQSDTRDASAPATRTAVHTA